jgi:tRNA A-37 threonylcarbamoyl transferase component Bud32
MKEVKITNKYVLTKFDKEDVNIFKNELFIYLLGKQKNISFIPKLVDYNCDKLYIKTENVGISLQEYCDEYGCEFEDSFIPKIKNIYDKFIKFGYYHNDLRLKNIIINPNSKKLYLIDFEFTDVKFKDDDDENIIKKFKGLNKSKSKSRSKSK